MIRRAKGGAFQPLLAWLAWLPVVVVLTSLASLPARADDRALVRVIAEEAQVHTGPGFGFRVVYSAKLNEVLPAIGRASHDKTKYPLDGKHQGTACAACHVPSKPEDARYRKVVFRTCTACHADKHKGEFGKDDCATCHSLKMKARMKATIPIDRQMLSRLRAFMGSSRG